MAAPTQLRGVLTSYKLRYACQGLSPASFTSIWTENHIHTHTHAHIYTHSHTYSHTTIHMHTQAHMLTHKGRNGPDGEEKAKRRGVGGREESRKTD